MIIYLRDTTLGGLKLHLQFEDRVGVVADVSLRLARAGLNIVSMEVDRTERRADLYLEAEPGEEKLEPGGIPGLLEGLEGLISIEFLESLPRERRENTFRVVLDNVSDGIISVDGRQRVTTINKVAREMLDFGQRPVEGETLSDLGFPDEAILACLNGRAAANEKRDLITSKGRFEYFSSTRPILDSRGRIVGAVQIMKDMREIRTLAKSASQPHQVNFSDFIGQSDYVRQLLSFAGKIASSEAIISIRGESGVGKELLARAVHAAGGRPGPFVAINCAALPENLLESELFGYEPGAFTGAGKKGKPGLFEAARKGTLFLDEIAEMPLGPQAKILRAIQEKAVRRIGGASEIEVDTRIITATNRDLEKMVEEKAFRRDLYFRLNVLPIHIRPLRDRPEDIPVLVEDFLFRLAAGLNKKVQTLTPEAMDKLLRHDWPGNVRELKNVIERASILSESEKIDVDGITFSFELGRSKKDGVGRDGPLNGRSEALKEIMGRYEAEVLRNVLESRSSVRAAARSLGISHTALLNKIRKYGLKWK